MWGSTPHSSTHFTVSGGSTSINLSGATYVAYLFASDAGGFGDDGSESIIKCGSYTGDGTFDHSIEVGFEPQWLLIKNTSLARDWVLSDSMRGLNLSQDYILRPNATTIEQNWAVAEVTSTGFRLTDGDDKWNTSGHNFIYIAIRRPMKTPESGTEVFSPVAYSGNSTAGRSITSGFPLDAVFTKGRNATIEPILYSRLQGSNRKLLTYSTSAEASSSTNVITSFDQDGMTVGTDADINSSAYTYINYFFKRATGFFDVVAYTEGS